jgi:ABC-type transport system involved in multi-copper enzyme maturation permease subunit
MTAIVHTQPDRLRTTTERSSPLLQVLAWELRRSSASRLFWVQALGFFGVVLFLTWALHASLNFSTMINGENLVAFVAGTSAWGLLKTLPFVLVILALLLPFVTVDGVTRDQQRRTHELLLTTALPTWAYVWGRYLAGLVMSLGLAGLLLVALLGMGELLHLTIPAYPAPEIGTLLLLWGGMVVSATILVSSVGFALGTLLPHLSTLIKVVILAAWIVGGVVIPLGLRNGTPPGWYVNWDPTSGVTGAGLRRAYSFNFASITSEAQLQHVLLTLENKLPNITSWLIPHLLLAVLSLALVVVAARTFKRSRAAFN